MNFRDAFEAQLERAQDPEALLALVRVDPPLLQRIGAVIGVDMSREKIAARGANSQPINDALTRAGELLRRNPLAMYTLFPSLREAVDGTAAWSSLCALERQLPPDGQPSAALKTQIARKQAELAAKFLALTGEPLQVDLAWLASKGIAFFRETIDLVVPPVSKLTSTAPRSSLRSPWSAATAGAEGVARTAGPRPASSNSRDQLLAATSVASATAAAPQPATAAVSSLYTFPQTLKTGEDIFYDYSIIIPVDCGCESAPPPSKDECSHDYSAVAPLVSMALAVIQALRDTHVADALGKKFRTYASTVDAVERFLVECVLPISGDFATLQRRKHYLRELAGTIRLAAKMQLLALDVNDVGAEYAALKAAIAALQGKADNARPFTTQSRRVPMGVTGGANAAGPEKGLWDKADASNAARANADLLYYPGDDPPPDAEWRYLAGPFATLTDARGYVYFEFEKNYNPSNYPQWSQLAPYLRKLGGRLPQIKELVSAADDVLFKLGDLDGAGGLGASAAIDEEVAKKLQALMRPYINEAANALSMILDTIADCLVPKPPRPIHSKRLGLQIVIRQHWFPQCYVQGKLVGYKSLMPGESQQVKRRTFVKTKREAVTASEYVSTRQNDFSNTQRDTNELVQEAASKFNFKVSASGHVNFGVWGAEGSTDAGGDISGALKSAHNSLSESVSKGSVSFNNKREVKITETLETENAEEVTSEVRNANNEITANYFYYQLLREYQVSTELYDIRPVAMVTRDYPAPTEIDEVFIAKYWHVLSAALPPQLASDAEATIADVQPLGRKMVRARGDAADMQAALDAFRKTLTSPMDDAQREQFANLTTAASDARKAFVDAEEAFFTAYGRLSRVVSHVRENILDYMGHIWQESSHADRDVVLREELLCGQRFDQVTQGMARVGVLGDEELFEFTGRSAALLDIMLKYLVPGTQVASLPDGDPVKERLIERVMSTCGLSSRAEAIAILQSASLFDEGGAGPSSVLTVDARSRRIQVAQNAIVIETMPGTVPLLEGYKLAHRALDAQRVALENSHLAGRISDRSWQGPHSSDEYRVIRKDTTKSEP